MIELCQHTHQDYRHVNITLTAGGKRWQCKHSRMYWGLALPLHFWPDLLESSLPGDRQWFHWYVIGSIEKRHASFSNLLSIRLWDTILDHSRDYNPLQFTPLLNLTTKWAFVSLQYLGFNEAICLMYTSSNLTMMYPGSFLADPMILFKVSIASSRWSEVLLHDWTSSTLPWSP